VNASVADLLDGFDHVETAAEFEQRLALGRPLRVKLGIDPTSADLHLGHMVVLHRLQRFAQAGHRVTLIIGDFTARIGDPSGRNVTRPQLSQEEIQANMATYTEQAGRVLDLDRIEIRYNSEWLDKLNFTDLVKLLAKTTVAQMLERNDFRERYDAGAPISLHELLYPVAQAYDSVAIEADVELGGTDQLFNLLLGRQFQREFGQRPQICATVPLLVGLDGEKKMSKSLGNYVGVDEPAAGQFGKLMKISDELLPIYARLAAFRPERESQELADGLAAARLNPMEEKKGLASEIVARYHGRDAASAAREFFERTVQRKEIPTENLDEIEIGDCKRVTDVLVKAGFAQSRREAERLIAGNAVKIDGELTKDQKQLWNASEPAVLSVGSRRFIRVLPSPLSPQ